MAYAYKRKITIDSTKIDATLADYPVMVKLDDTNFDFTKAKADGSDIRFTDTNDNLLKHEKVEYNPGGSGQGAPPPPIGRFNVQIPEVSSTIDTEFYMHYGNPDAYNTSIEAWQDQTGKELTYNGNVKLDWDSGVGRRVAKFDGDGDYFTVPDSSDLRLGTTYTIEFWVNLSAKNSIQNDILAKGYYLSGVSGGFTIRNITSARNGLEFWGSTSNTSVTVLFQDLGQLPTAQWSNVAITSTGANTYIFLNGVLLQTTTTVFNLSGSGHPLIISGNTTSCSINGSMRGLRITKGRARYTSNFTPPTSFEIDGSDVVFCTNFDTIYDNNFVMVQHMGDSLVDATGNGNNGTNYGSTVVDGLNGKARSFDGVDDYILVTQNASLNNAHYTYTFVSKLNVPLSSQSYNYPMLFYKRGATVGNALYYSKIASELQQSFGSGSTLNYGDYAIDYDTTDYMVISITHDGTSGKLYNLGILKDEIVSAHSAGTESISIGNGANHPANCTIDEVRISNIARSDAWIKADDYNLRQWNLYSWHEEEELSKRNAIFFGFNF